MFDSGSLKVLRVLRSKSRSTKSKHTIYMLVAKEHISNISDTALCIKLKFFGHADRNLQPAKMQYLQTTYKQLQKKKTNEGKIIIKWKRL